MVFIKLQIVFRRDRGIRSLNSAPNHIKKEPRIESLRGRPRLETLRGKLVNTKSITVRFMQYNHRPSRSL